MRRVGAACALALLCGCNPSVQQSASPSPSPTPTSSGLSLKISGRGTAQRPVRFVATNQDRTRVQYDLLASSFESVGAQGSARAQFSHVHVTFHGKDGSTLVAEAPRAIVDQVTNTIRMEGGVRAKNDRGTSLSCDVLTFDHVTEMFYGTGHVAIVSANGFRATGNTFESNISLTRTRMQ